MIRLIRAHKLVSREFLGLTTRAMCSNSSEYQFETLNVTTPKEFVFHVEINRPDKLNAMNLQFWRDLRRCFDKLSSEPECRAIVVSAAGRMFTAGIDLSQFASIGAVVMDPDKDAARRAIAVKPTITELQESFTSMEKCNKPVIAAVHSACIGGGIDMIAACDIRYCTQDAWFQIKEVDVGLAADLGTLQRLPKIVGNDSLVRELTYTARKFYSDEAKSFGLVSRIFADKDSLLSGSLEMAAEIASKSPIAVQTSKQALLYARDHSVEESLEHINLLNQVMLQSEDVIKATTAAMTKEKPVFSKL